MERSLREVSVEEIDVDPFELHARQYLSRFQSVVRQFRETTENLDALTLRLDKYWPQILAAFSWSGRHRPSSSAAAEICDALVNCGVSESLVGVPRSAEDFRRWGASAMKYAEQLKNDANSFAFVGAFASLAKTEATLSEMASDVRTHIGELLALKAGSASQPE